jgi:antibiotic biosynthesis monooxygenase (ABM) superfamily enzyme
MEPVPTQLEETSQGRAVKEAIVIISLFGEVVVKPGKETDEARLTDKLSPILRSIPGFISSKNYRADDGEEIGIVRMASLEALDAWSTRECTARPRSSRTRSTSAFGSRAPRRSASTPGRTAIG